MDLTNEFEVGVGLDDAWRVLTDVERIAPCLPGAELREIEGDEFRGVVKVRVGPISAEYKGAAHFVELDADTHRAVLRAEGRETKGQGNASATITAQLAESDKGTKVSVETNLAITGKVAQFGRGVLADISAKLLAQFVDNLESTVLSAEAAPPQAAAKRGAGTQETAETNGKGGAGEDDGSTVRKVESIAVEPVDLVEIAGASVAKRLLPLLIVAAAIIAAVLWRRRSG